MIVLYFFTILFFVFLLVFVSIAKKYKNPYKLYFYFGKKGSGKTMQMYKMMYKLIKMGKSVYCNEKFDFPDKFPGEFHQINPYSLGVFVPPPESYVFIDEVGMIWDNRNYKDFKECNRNYFKYQRHYRNTVYLFSQTFDIDLKIRVLTDFMYLCRNVGNVFVYSRRINRKLDIVEATADSESKIVDNLFFTPLIFQLFGGGVVNVCYIPRWAKKYNSFSEIVEHAKS